MLRVDLQTLIRARWQHRVDQQGRSSTTIEQVNGTLPEFDVVFHRIQEMHSITFPGWTATDVAYGRTEWLALVLSWLRGMGQRVINAPTFGKLNGHDDNPWKWIALAIAAGFPVLSMGASTNTRVFPLPQHALEFPALNPWPSGIPLINGRTAGYATTPFVTDFVRVVGDQVLGNVGDLTHERCARLAAVAQLDIVGVQLARERGDSDWRFAGAWAAPALDDPSAVAATALLMERRAL